MTTATAATSAQGTRGFSVDPGAIHPRAPTAAAAQKSGVYAHGYTAPKANAPHASTSTIRAGKYAGMEGGPVSGLSSSPVPALRPSWATVRQA